LEKTPLASQISYAAQRGNNFQFRSSYPKRQEDGHRFQSNAATLARNSPGGSTNISAESPHVPAAERFKSDVKGQSHAAGKRPFGQLEDTAVADPRRASLGGLPLSFFTPPERRRILPPDAALGDEELAAYATAMHRETFSMLTAKAAPLLTMSAESRGFAATDLLGVAQRGTQMMIALGHLCAR
jgi:hypothetical protein